MTWRGAGVSIPPVYEISKSFFFCYGHRLIGHAGRCRYLHGHNARADVVLAADTLDALGMVTDFGAIKDSIGRWIDEELDHNLLLYASDPVLPLLRGAGERVYVMDVHPTAENIARLIFVQAQHLKLPVVAVELWETETSRALYRP